jgi:hypothetical protein
MRCRNHADGYCPPRISGHNQAATPLRLLAVVEDNQPVTLAELPALLPDTDWRAVRRAYYRLLKSGELVAESNDRITLGRT